MDTTTIKHNYPIDKDRKHEWNNLNENIPDEDESVLRQPLRTSLAGFREAKRAYENGTDEVRRLLMQECSLIYECNVCRNMFRSLANFISHKRIYCKQTTEGNSYQSYSGHNSSVLIQTVERPEPWLNKSRSTGSSPVPPTTTAAASKPTNRDLSKVIERLKRVDVSSEPKQASRQESVIQAPSTSPGTSSDPVLQLERVPTSTQAVYQTLTTAQNVSDSIKTEVDEVHNLLTNQKTLVGEDGKAIVKNDFVYGPDHTLASNDLTSFADPHGINNSNMNFLAIVCEICQMPFQTEKTLKIHIQKKHSSSTYVFQCPTCSLTFLQPAAVIRHLANEHKKPLRRIRKMRDTILKKRIQIGDVQVKGPSREVKRLKLNDDTKDDNMLQQQNDKPISTCTYCKKNFERRAALATHLMSCPARKWSTYTAPTKNSKEMPAAKSKIDNNEKSKTQTKMQSQIPKEPKQNQNQNLKNEIKNVEQTTIVNIKQEPLDELNSNGNSATTESTTTTSTINEMFENLENQTFGSGLQTVSLDKLEMMVESKNEDVLDHDEDNEEDDEDEEEEMVKQETNKIDNEHDEGEISKTEETAVNKEKKKTKRCMPPSKQLACCCKICNKQFNALSNLRRHISMFHYRSRRFGCNLCDYRAFRRYDIVNHLTFVHKMTGERESMAVDHVTVHDIKYSKDDVEGDIVVVNEQQQQQVQTTAPEDVVAAKVMPPQELQVLPVNTLKTYEKRGKRKKVLLPTNNEPEVESKEEAATSVEVSHIKVVRSRLKKALAHQAEGPQIRPIRNRIKTVNKDFVYDLPTLKEELKETARLGLKRRNTLFVDHKNPLGVELIPPPIKISPYRLRTEPLIAVSKETIKGFAASVYRNAVHEGLAAPSTLPELPAERPQMRTRLISASRNDTNPVPIIESSDLEAACLKSTLFDDSFLEKFAKKANPSFRMKPLVALQHSPLNSILQKFDATLQNNSKQLTPQTSIEETSNSAAAAEVECAFVKPLEKLNSFPPPNYCSLDTLSALSENALLEVDVTPNGKHISEPASPPSAPKKRITLMQRLAENRAKRRDSLLRNALEN